MKQHTSTNTTPTPNNTVLTLLPLTWLPTLPYTQHKHPNRQNATHQDAFPVAHFKGFANVKQRSETALMWALWKHGPVAISIDASQPTFKFYSEGVYSDKNCHTGKVGVKGCVR